MRFLLWIFVLLCVDTAVAADCMRFKINPSVFISKPDWKKTVVQPYAPMDLWHGNVVATLVDKYDISVDVNQVDDGICVWLKSVDAVIGYNDFTVQIDIRHTPDTCAYNAVLNHEVVIFNTPDASHSSIPPETLDDDILKKLIKRAISKKGVDLDQYKIRFASKNMLFNTKQVLRGPNRLSMLLFDRCTEALNLKYTIIIEEAGGETIGRPLDSELIISSQDVFDANIEVSNKDEVE